jgi:hypothetical protein
MSDTPQGPDWWQASDDKWYPPPRPEMPGDADATAVSPSGPVPPAGPVPGPPTGPPTGPPSGGFPPAGGFPPGAPPSGGFPPGAPGPYGGMPPGAQQPGQQNRTPLYIAIGVVVAAALVGLIVVLTGGDDDPDTDPTASTNTTESGPPTTTVGPDDPADPPATESDPDEPAGNGDVEVVEQGFSNFMGGFDQDERSASYGFIVENTSDELATDISISVSAFAADGTALASASHTVYVLRPGEKMGVGDEFYGENFAAEVAELQVQVSEPSDYGLEDVPDEGALTAEGITTSADEYGVTTTFTAKSTYAQQIDSPYVYAIYRDAAGEIIGGSYDFLDFIAANGSTAGEVSSYENIPNIASTEVYLDPGYFY